MKIRTRLDHMRTSALPVLLVMAILALSVAAALALCVDPAHGEEAGDVGPAVPSAAQTLEAIESAGPENRIGPETDLHAAQTMPHRDLGTGEALDLAEAVFGPELEGSAGIYEELEPERYLSDYAAIVPASSLPEGAGGSGEGLPAEHPNQPVLLESTLPLRTENASGEEEAVDLELEHSEGELQPANPLAEVGIPRELGEGISLGGPEIGVTVADAPAADAPTDAEGRFAFYPEVAETPT